MSSTTASKNDDNGAIWLLLFISGIIIAAKALQFLFIYPEALIICLWANFICACADYVISDNNFEETGITTITAFVATLILGSCLYVLKIASPELLSWLDSFEYLQSALKTKPETSIIEILPYSLIAGAGIYMAFKFFSKNKLAGTHFIENLNSMFSKLFNFKLKSKKKGLKLGKGRLSKSDFILSDKSLASHTQIIGGTGYGKTNLLKNIIEEQVKKGECIIFIDYKAELEMTSWVKRCLNNYGREEDFRLFSIDYPKKSIFYNTIHGKSPSENASKFMNIFTWSDEYYKSRSFLALTVVLSLLSELKENNIIEDYDLIDVYSLIDSGSLYEKLNNNNYGIEKFVHAEAVSKLYSKEFQSDIAGLKSNLSKIVHSDLKNNIMASSQNTDLKEVIKSKKFLYVQMNSMKDESLASSFGKLLLEDIINLVGDENAHSLDPNLKCNLIIDEFASFATNNFINLINRCRSVGMRIFISHQSIADLKQKHLSGSFYQSINSNTSNKIVFKTKNSDDAEFFSGMLGTKSSQKMTYQIDQEVLSGRGTVRDSNQFKVHPDTLKQLEIGEALCIQDLPKCDFDIVKFDLANEFLN